MFRKTLVIVAFLILLSILITSPIQSQGGNVQITSPANGVTLEDREVDIIGTTSLTGSGLRAELNEFETAVDGSGNFVIPAFPLVDGENVLEVQIFDSADNLLGSDSITVFWFAPAEAAIDINPPNGGIVEITDSSSELFGAKMEIPFGAATRSFRARIEYDSEHVPNVPFGEIAVGPPVVFAPIGEQFAAPITLTLPVDSALFPGGTDINDVIVRAMADDSWVELPITTRSLNSVQVMVDSLIYSPFIPAISIPLTSGMVRVTTSPANATLYIDGFNTSLRTQAELSNVDSGEHTLKVYLPGFNEVFQTVYVPPEGIEVHIELGAPTAPVPVVTFDPSIQDGMEVSDNIFNFFGTVSYDGVPLTGGIAVVSLSGEDSFANVNSDGSFLDFVSLLPGDNQLEVRVTGPNGSTGVSQLVNIFNSEGAAPPSSQTKIYLPLVIKDAINVTAALNGPQQKSPKQSKSKLAFANDDNNYPHLVKAVSAAGVTVVLTWNKDDTDVDMHVFDPDDNHAWFGALGGIPGAAIDHDDVDGFGPETFTMLEPRLGLYKVRVNYYSDHGNGPTVATLRVFIGGDLVFQDSYNFTQGGFNPGGGQGSNSPSFWNAYEFTIGELAIVNVQTQTASPRKKAIFTTHPDENLITVEVDAPDHIQDDKIMFEIKEVNEDFEIDTSNLQGRRIEFRAAHEPLTGLINPRHSRPLEYQIIAFTLDDQGQRDLESEPVILKQDTRSQIRQEYVDKRNFNSTFVRQTPAYASIIDASGFPNAPNFTFNEFSAYSDFGPGLAVIDDSVNIAQAVRNEWGFPLRVTSGWRNPRRNDSLPNSSINSFHQTGDAVDLNPSRNSNNWPAGTTSYQQAQQRLVTAARRTLNLTIYDTLFHANHLHIERDPNGSPNR